MAYIPSQDRAERPKTRHRTEVLWQVLGREARSCDGIQAIFWGPIFRIKSEFCVSYILYNLIYQDFLHTYTLQKLQNAHA